MIERIDASPRMSQAVVHGGTVYIAGQVDRKSAATVAEQTRNILMQIDDLLARAGSDRGRLLSAQFWLTDMRRFDDMNAEWDAWIGGANAPARATVEARLAAPQILVEIAVIAATS